MSSLLNTFKLSERGVFVQASTLGSLEALVDFLKSSKIPVSTCACNFHDLYLFKFLCSMLE